MGMPVIVEIVDKKAKPKDFEEIFAYFDYVDKKFSTYKEDSEISHFNQGKINREQFSDDMKEIFALAEKTKRETNGYFDIFHGGKCDPSGIVKGWAIQNAAELLEEMVYKDFYVEVAGDIEVAGNAADGEPWKIGIRNPFNAKEIVKAVRLEDQGIATSGNYIRGEHIYDPHGGKAGEGIVSLTVIGPNVYEADRFATAAYAMGPKGIGFIEKLPGFEGYMIDSKGIATMTTGFEKLVIS